MFKTLLFSRKKSPSINESLVSRENRPQWPFYMDNFGYANSEGPFGDRGYTNPIRQIFFTLFHFDLVGFFKLYSALPLSNYRKLECCVYGQIASHISDIE